MGRTRRTPFPPRRALASAQATQLRSPTSHRRTSPVPPLPRLQNGPLWRNVSLLFLEIPVGWLGFRGPKGGGTSGKVGKAGCEQSKASPRLQPSCISSVGARRCRHLVTRGLAGVRGMLCWGGGRWKGHPNPTPCLCLGRIEGPVPGEDRKLLSKDEAERVAVLSFGCCNALG